MSPASNLDSVDRLLAEWRREAPALTVWPLGILARVLRLSHLLVRRSEGWLRPFDLTWESFSLIVTLRRAGKPFALRPTDLYRESLLSSAAITSRIDRVEAMGLVERRPDPDDRRGVLVRLTPAGKALADRTITAHVAAMAETLSGLDAGERRELTRLLAKALGAVENAK